jgi:raffinose/stachyose/melibiose transport system substrate-binding protein
MEERSMKKVASLLLATVMVLGLLSGCKGTSTAKENITLNVLTHWTNLTSTDLKDLADGFKKDTGITIKYTSYTDYNQDVTTRLNSNNYGDVLEIPDGVDNKDLSNFFVNLGKSTDAKLKDIAFTDAKATANKDGSYNTYGISYGIGLEGAVYNKAAFTKAGISAFPKTTDELYADAAKLKAAGIVPLAINYKDKWPLTQFSTMAEQAAGDENYWNNLYKQKDIFAADQPFGQVLGILNKFVSSGWVESSLATTNWEGSKTDMATGKVGMMFLGTWAISQMRAAGTTPNDIGFAPIPCDNSGKLYSVAGADKFQSVSNKSKYKTEAEKFLFYYINSDFCSKQGFMPINKTHTTTNADLKTFMASGVKLMYTPTLNDNKTTIANEAKIGFFEGTFLQPICDASLKSQAAYTAAIAALNKSWDDAKTSKGF